jgi:putative NADH-flavin reductase
MKIVLFGANGKTGMHLIEQSLEKGYQVNAFVRRENVILIKHPNLKIITGSLNNEEKLKEAITGSDVCISTLGGASLTKHAPDIIAGIDRIVRIMEQEGVKRFIYLSSGGAGESRYNMVQPIRFIVADLLLRVPLADHNANEQRLQKSSLNWTFVRPGSLTDGPLIGNLKYGSGKNVMKGNPKTSRANLAAFMLDQIANPDYINKGVWLHE